MSSNGQINGRDNWISTDGKQALWYYPTHSNWKIGSKSKLGSAYGGLSSKSDTACPTSNGGNKWMFWDGKWVDAGNDVQAACDDGK